MNTYEAEWVLVEDPKNDEPTGAIRRALIKAESLADAWAEARKRTQSPRFRLVDVREVVDASK